MALDTTDRVASAIKEKNAEIANLKGLLVSLLPILDHAAAGTKVSMAAGDMARRVRAFVGSD